MKRFIIISLLALVTTATARACAWVGTDNYYLFSVYDPSDFRYRVDDITRENWKAYLGLSKDDWFYFDADEIIDVARKKNDALMVSYVQNLQKYLSCASEVSEETWNYPTKEELAERAAQLSSVRSYALGQVKSRLRSQHGLLYMRCNMLMGRHQENVDFWEQTAKDFIETVYKDMMENIYAGALLKCGRGGEAGQIFARQGDWESLMTMYYEKRSYQAIRQEYLRDPNSATLPFLLQDFVNNVQEAADQDGYGKLFVRDINQAEARQMIDFCTQVANEGKSQMPLLWLTAKAWMEYMVGSEQQALKDIRMTVGIDGPERLMNVARIIRLYIDAATSSLNTTFENTIASELTWLEGLKASDDYYDHAYYRVMRQTVIEKYRQAGHRHTVLQLEAHSDPAEYSYYLDTAKVEDIFAYLAYCKRPAVTAFEKYLKSHVAGPDEDSPDFKDFIGTKYLRLCQWKEAVQWLQQVPASYYDDKGYACYAVYRHWSVEPWVKRQWLTSEQQYGEDRPRLRANPKLVYAQEMQKMEGEAHILSGQALYQKQYDLAIRYAQANGSGDCWFLLHDGKSFEGEAEPNEVDYLQRANDLLRKAGRTTSRQLKERVLFARAYYYLNPDCWYVKMWDSNLSENVIYPNEEAQQYRAFAALADFEKQNPDGPSDYVSRCDEYIQFRKFYK